MGNTLDRKASLQHTVCMNTKAHNSKHFLILLFILMAISASTVAQAESRFINNNNGTVTDELTELTWIQDPATVLSIAGERSWMEARSACRELSFAGIGPNVWKLPKIRDLQSLLDRNFKNPQINPEFFSSEAGSYWSDTTYNPGEKAWMIDFKNGTLEAAEKFNSDKPTANYVRCVAKI